jgi:hypothetical protein
MDLECRCGRPMSEHGMREAIGPVSHYPRRDEVSDVDAIDNLADEIMLAVAADLKGGDQFIPHVKRAKRVMLDHLRSARREGPLY